MTTATMPTAKAPRRRADRPRARLAIRSGELTGPTSGLAPGYVQGNLAILPDALAGDFLRFCQLNPKPCPLLASSAPGDWRLPSLGEDLDIRTDVPRYRVFRNGELVDEPTDVRALLARRSGQLRARLLVFVRGGADRGRHRAAPHHAAARAVPMYRTIDRRPTPAGPFHGPLVVSMRPIKPADAIRAIQITTRFPAVHGAPVHIGKPELIGIKDIAKPDYGDPVPINDDEIPVFWACGVTPQSVVATVKPEFCITHYPGSMLVTDRRNSEFAIM